MPRMRSLDDSERHPGNDQTPGVCEPAPVHYPRKHRENWPFRLYEENGTMYENIAPRRKKVNLDDAEDAPW